MYLGALLTMFKAVQLSIEYFPSTVVSIFLILKSGSDRKFVSSSAVVIYSARTSPVHWIILVCYSAILEVLCQSTSACGLADQICLSIRFTIALKYTNSQGWW